MACQLSRLGHFARYFVKISSSRPVIGFHNQIRRLNISAACLGDPVKIRMPALSPTMETGTIVKWYKNEGDAVAPGDVLCDIQTDKAVVSFEFEEEGVLAKIIKPQDTKDITIGTLIALMVEEGDDWKNVAIPEDAEPATETSTAAAPAPAAPSTTTTHSAGHAYGPAVRTILDSYALNVADVPATGPHGRLLKGDLLRYIKEKGLKRGAPKKEAAPVAPPTPVAAAPPTTAPAPTPMAPAPPAVAAQTEGYTDLEVTSMRRIIAKRLTESKTTIPHSYATADCVMDSLLTLRKDLIAEGIKVSVNDFIVKAVALALQRVPAVNATWGGESALYHSNIDVCVAVATDSGLITPIVQNAIGLSVKEISETVKELAGRARQNRLKLDEFQGGTFTISNLGMFGISEFSAVINPPQACILAIGSSRLVLDSTGKPQTLMAVTLSSDARMVDDELAARFLEEFRYIMESPMLMVSDITSSMPRQSTHQDPLLKALFAK